MRAFRILGAVVVVAALGLAGCESSTSPSGVTAGPLLQINEDHNCQLDGCGGNDTQEGATTSEGSTQEQGSNAHGEAEDVTPPPAPSF